MAINQLISYVAKSVGVTASTVFTAPANLQTVISGWSIANTTALPVTASVYVTRSGQDVFIVRDATVPAQGSLVVAGEDQKIVVIAGDLVRVISSAAASLDVVISVLHTGGAAAPSQPVVVGPVPPPPSVPSSTRAFTVAQSTNQGLFTTDGTTWTEVTLPSSGIWLDTNYNPASPGRACALRWAGAIYSTNYGASWVLATGMGGGDGSVSALAPVTSTVWLTVGTGTANYYRSTDNGQTWSVFNFGSVYNGHAIAGVGAGLAVIVTNSLTYYTTTDGSTFTPRTFPSNPGGATGFRRIEHVNGLYIAMELTLNRYIMTSSDGINWTVRDVSLGVSPGGSFKDISFGGALPGTWLIVCDSPAVYFTSTDLATWTRRTLPAARRWTGVAWIGGQWVAIVDGDTAGGNIKANSADGIVWTESALASTNRRWADLTEVR